MARPRKPAEKSKVSRATPERGSQRTTDETDLLVLEIADLMSKGNWVAGVSHNVLVTRELVSLVQVQHWATQASRLLRLWQNPEDVEAKRSENVARLDRLYNDNKTASPKVAVYALAEQNQLLGLIVKKHEHTVAVKNYDALPREGKVSWLRSKAERLLAEADRLEGVVANVVNEASPNTERQLTHRRR